MRIGSLFASARAQVRTAASRRRLHLTADKAEELLSSVSLADRSSPQLRAQSAVGRVLLGVALSKQYSTWHPLDFSITQTTSPIAIVRPIPRRRARRRTMDRAIRHQR